MKTEKEIRKRIADQTYARKSPCECGPKHALECHTGGRMMDAAISALQWVLEESPDEERMAEGLAAFRSRSGGQP